MGRYLSLPKDLIDRHQARKLEQEGAEEHTHKKDIHQKPKEIQTKNIFDKKDTKLPEDFNLKVADLGNACWKHHHFSPEI
mmetsp:Transcript_6023/g.5358  ORF Transcript_6023/g.5358 Transcript_6023/m.5358 type:complete len:80 (-) Transcript_6023:486-725(-)